MKKSVVSFVLFLGLLLVPLGALAEEGSQTGLLGVVFSEKLTKNEIVELTNQVGGEVVYVFKTFSGVLLKVSEDKVDGALGQLKSNPYVESVELDDQPAYTAATSNDPLLEQQWALDNVGQLTPDGQMRGGPFSDIDAYRCWDSYVGNGTRIVAIVDTGVDVEHPDLAANIWINNGEIPGNGVDDDGNGLIDDWRGWDFSGADNDPSHIASDDTYHGTHVAGIVGAVGNNGVGVSGVGWNIKIMAFRVGSNTSVNAFYCAAATDYAVYKGADVVNHSWGTRSDLSIVRTAFQAASNAGVLTVCCAQNLNFGYPSYDNDDYPVYPANYDFPLNLSVANTTATDYLSGSSRYGDETVQIAAPGSRILSTFGVNSEDGYGILTGTSMSAPMVAGSLGYLLGYYNDYLNTPMDGLAAKQRMLDRAVHLSQLDGLVQNGRRLSLYRMIAPEDSIYPATITDLTIESVDSKTINLSWTAPGDDGNSGTVSGYAIYAPTNLDFYDSGQTVNLNTVRLDSNFVAAGQTQYASIPFSGYSQTRHIRVVAYDEFRNQSYSNIVVGTSASAPAFEVPTTTLYSWVQTNESFTASLVIRSQGGSDLDYELTTEDTWLSFTPSEGSIAPGDSVVVNVTADATGMCDHQVGSIQIEGNGYPYAVSVSVLAIVTPIAGTLTSDPSSLDFGEVPIFSIATETIQILNIGCQDVTFNAPTFSSSTWVSSSKKPITLAPGGSAAVSVSFVCGTVGSHTGQMYIASTDPNSPLTVNLSGVGVLSKSDPSGNGDVALGMSAVPNPFNPTTEFKFTMANEGIVELNIYDIRGRLVRRLGDRHMAVGEQTIQWDGRDNLGNVSSSGQYLAQISINGKITGPGTRVVLLK